MASKLIYTHAKPLNGGVSKCLPDFAIRADTVWVLDALKNDPEEGGGFPHESETKLTLASRHVAKGADIIARQRAIIFKL